MIIYIYIPSNRELHTQFGFHRMNRLPKIVTGGPAMEDVPPWAVCGMKLETIWMLCGEHPMENPI